jgi:hypothetical protein
LDPAVSAESLTSRQRTIVLAVALVCAASRLLALARSVWEWDEALFTMAMRDYDVTLHHPHPPGFPVYIAAARIARLLISDDFRALQAVNLVAAMLVFPAVYLFARELRVSFRTSVSAAALFAFFPNVWFFGGGAFSDIPSIVLVLFAVTFLLRGRRERSAYFIGTLLLALAIGIRPQNLLIGLIPGFLATRRRRWWEVLVALLIGIVVVGTAFGGAIRATGSFEHYMQTVGTHADYISRVDSYRSEARPPLWRILDRFFLKQYQSPVLSVLASLFVLVAVAGSIRERSRPMFLNALAFLPFAIFAWLMLDRFSISRFSIGYQPMFALLVADGIRRVGKRHEPLLATALVAGFVAFTGPALGPVRRDVSPSIVAAQTAAQIVNVQRERLFVSDTMLVFMDLVAPGTPYARIVDDRALPLDSPERAWMLAEITTTKEEGFLFKRERGNLWNIARRHYFEIKLAPFARRAEFLQGWHPAEGSETNQWRWMARHSLMTLPAAEGETLLRLRLDVPAELVPMKPVMTVRLNGRVVGTITDLGDFTDRDFHVLPASAGQPNTLELLVNRTLPAREGEPERSVRLRYLAWGPA